LREAQYKFYIDWDNDGDFTDPEEDVSDRVVARDSVQFAYGRDEARSLSSIQAGESSFAPTTPTAPSMGT
jgi:hypothetical protein